VVLEAFAVFLPDTDANREGDLYYSTYDADTDTVQNIVYLYVTADGTVKGCCRTSAGNTEDGYDTSDSYDLTLKAGWNRIITTDTTSLRRVAYSLKTGPLLEGLTWQYLDHSSFPKMARRSHDGLRAGPLHMNAEPPPNFWRGKRALCAVEETDSRFSRLARTRSRRYETYLFPS
jgi:hypothetical protein